MFPLPKKKTLHKLLYILKEIISSCIAIFLSLVVVLQTYLGAY